MPFSSTPSQMHIARASISICGPEAHCSSAPQYLKALSISPVHMCWSVTSLGSCSSLCLLAKPGTTAVLRCPQRLSLPPLCIKLLTAAATVQALIVRVVAHAGGLQEHHGDRDALPIGHERRRLSTNRAPVGRPPETGPRAALLHAAVPVLARPHPNPG